MPQPDNAIRCTYTDPHINDLLRRTDGGSGVFTRHYNQGEEFFLRLGTEYTVPQLPIHHDVRIPAPEPRYIQLLCQVLDQLIRRVPQLFADLTYAFDPEDILHPSFFHLYRLESCQYLYLLRLDLMYRPQMHELLHRGSNDLTAAYASDCLFLEATCIPLSSVQTQSGKIGTFVIDQTISNTWVDEIGRGYMVQGVWMDNDLTRFFSKLFLPEGKRTYPFYPYVCKYKTVCQNLIDPDPRRRTELLPFLHRALEYLRPVMPEIEDALRRQAFSEQLETFRRLRGAVPPEWKEIWSGLRVEMYLNRRDLKEYRIDTAAR
ncbi:MAG: hypothetical protein JXB06_14620 [Spirochaetales bacterium]|nr:hypothetical protein [Spirochaetales bacterium]